MDQNGFIIRKVTPADHSRIMSVMVDWWKGRDLRGMLPKLFCIHFQNTSFIAEKEGDLAGFLVGFFSPSVQGEGYIHFAGINPQYRKKGLGRLLYNTFSNLCRDHKIHTIRSCTSPVNKESIAFHKSIGFMIEPGDSVVDGIAITENYNRENDPKVLFKKTLI